jgi:hypothetical protein
MMRLTVVTQDMTSAETAAALRATTIFLRVGEPGGREIPEWFVFFIADFLFFGLSSSACDFFLVGAFGREGLH